MLELIIVAFFVYVGYQVGVSVTAWRLRDIVYKEAKARGMVSKEDQILFEGEDKPRVSKLWIEKVHDILYLYDTEDTFICQATSLEELAKLALKYKNIKYASVMNGEDIFAFVDGKVKSAKEILK
jgi:hypothetical protein